MTGFRGHDLLTALPWIVGAVALVLVITFAVAKWVGKHSVIDSAWGLLFVAVALASFGCSFAGADDVRRWLLLLMPLLWGVRLAEHIGRRTVGKPEDPRYEKLLAKAKGNRDWYAIRSIYLLQGLLALLISTPIMIGAFERGSVGPLAWVGVALWLVGVYFEAVGDHQMESFRHDPANHGHVIDIGLWRYTRHPNYFGDACVWWGIFLVAAEHWPGVLTILAPIGMTLLLTKGSGARIMEAHLRDRPGWDEYKARTSPFVPLPPRRSATRRDPAH
jgi:steroid 5-alpha reductase family enzyme